MIPLSQLKRAADDAVAYLRSQADVREAEVFISANNGMWARLNYTSHIPSNGVEEPKSLEGVGLAIRAAFESSPGVRFGHASEPGDLSVAAVERALARARQGVVTDPEFRGLPMPGRKTPEFRDRTGRRIMRITNKGLVEAGWDVVEGALDVFSSNEDLLGLAGSPEALGTLGLILGGDVAVQHDRVAVASTNFRGVRTDDSQLVTVLATSMVERRRAKGTGWRVGRSLDLPFREAGRQAARDAIAGLGHQRVREGSYRVVLGPLVITDILNFFMLSYFSAGTFSMGASPFMGRLGQRVASEELSMYDEGAAPGMAASRRITDEGVSTGRVDLLRNGRLVGLLSNWYESQRLIRGPKAREKLGVDPAEWTDGLAPRNGFRLDDSGARTFEASPGISATNLVLEGATPQSHDDLLRLVGDGLYIGRTWYTYPINGIAAADFSGTIIGDSYAIRNGRLAEPVRPNTLRINDNAVDLLQNIIGVGSERRPSIVWSAGQVVHAPEIAVSSLAVRDIGGYMEGMTGEGDG